MHAPIGLIVFIIFSIFSGPMTRRMRGRAREAWQEAARDLGLDLHKGSFFQGDAIAGRVDGVEVRVDTFRRSQGKSSATYTRIRVRAPGVPGNLSLGNEGFFSSIQKALGGQDIQTDDKGFDELLRIRGDEAQVVALLGDEARRAVRREVGGSGVSVRDGEAYWETRGHLRDRVELVSRVRGMIDLEKQLTLGSTSIHERLSRNALADRNPRVRLRNLVLLQRRAPSSREAVETSRALMDFADPSVRLAAAMHLGDEGLATIEALVNAPDVDAALMSDALQHLIANVPVTRVGGILESALDSHHEAVQHVAIQGITKLGHRGAIDRLVRVGDGDSTRLTVTVATALAQLGDPRAEPALVRWLGRNNEAVCIAAARALGTIGTVAAVEPLLPHTKGLLTDADLKRAAREAIEKIQSRLGDVEAGRLSLSEVAQRDGALSLSEEAGKLSMAPDESAGSPVQATEPPPRAAESESA
jgi:HEAT repeat protein